MGERYTESQKRASLKYQKSKAQIKITVDKSKREKWKRYAEENNTTLTELITTLLDNKIED